MLIAAKFYKDVDVKEKPEGIPDTWIAELVELKEGEPAPDGFQTMTEDEHKKYVEDQQPAYDTWKAAQDVAQAEVLEAKSAVTDSIRFGRRVIEEFSVYFNTNLPGQKGVECLVLQPLVFLLSFGFLVEAASQLEQLPGGFLDSPYAGKGATVREHFIKIIQSGSI